MGDYSYLIFTIIFFITLNSIYSWDKPDSYWPPGSCPSYPPIGYPNCQHSQFMAIVNNVYNEGVPFNDLNNVGIYCDTAKAIDGDGMLLCNGNNLPFNSDFILAFSGSQNVDDFIDDADVIPVLNKEVGIGMLTHTGFNDKFYQWKDTIDEWVPSCNSSLTYTVVGHSLGAAVAHISSLYLMGKGCNVQLYTIGEPATFKEPLAESVYLLPHTRYGTYYHQHQCWESAMRDIVVTCADPFGYVHPTTAPLIGVYREDNCEISSTTYSNSIPNESWGVDPFIHLTCHYTNFIENIFCV